MTNWRAVAFRFAMAYVVWFGLAALRSGSEEVGGLRISLSISHD